MPFCYFIRFTVQLVVLDAFPLFQSWLVTSRFVSNTLDACRSHLNRMFDGSCIHQSFCYWNNDMVNDAFQISLKCYLCPKRQTKNKTRRMSGDIFAWEWEKVPQPFTLTFHSEQKTQDLSRKVKEKAGCPLAVIMLLSLPVKQRRDECDASCFIQSTKNVQNCDFAQVWIRVCFTPLMKNPSVGAHMGRTWLHWSKMGKTWQNGVKCHHLGHISGAAHQCPTTTAGRCPVLGTCGRTAQVMREVE